MFTLNRRAFLELLPAVSAGIFAACTSSKIDAPYFKTRGLILDVHDLSTVDWPTISKSAGITTLATHITPSQVAAFAETEKGKAFFAACKANGIAVEHELHALGDLLPRTLFEEDPTMFRMDENGQRVAKYNLCVHSEKAIQIICDNAVKYSKLLPSTTGRYFYWIDDGKPMCKCEKCSLYSESEQALLLENEIIKALRSEVDTNATLAHLAYQNTLEAPVKVKPNEGIFLEFAPIHRDWNKSLLESDVQGWDERFTVTHGDYLRLLDDNLKVFPVETAQVLEYWLDVSLFSRWKKPAVALPWNPDMFLNDIDVYAKRGIRHITTFAVYIDDEYIKNHKDISFVQEYGKGLLEYKKK